MARRPIWLWPNLLSLDAPLVAVAWFWVFKEVWLVEYHYASLPWLLAVAVWSVYVADRLMDERLAQTGSRRETARHRFHRRHRKLLTLGLVGGILGSLFLLYFQARGLHKHGIFVLVPLTGYFAVSFFESGRAISYFKNLLAGLTFAYGTAVGVHFHSPNGYNVLDLIFSAEVLTFAVLCSMNMTAIDHWENPWEGEESGEKDLFELALSVLLVLLGAFALLMAVRAERQGIDIEKAFFVSIMVGAGALYGISRLKNLFSRDALRVLADVAMLLPLPVFYGMTQFSS